jgi:hypothetical protein
MRWICHIAIQGFYAAVARQQTIVAVDRPIVVLREGRVYDGCRAAFTAGLVLGTPARQVLRDVANAGLVEWSQVNGEALAHPWWDECLAHTPYIEPLAPHEVYLALPIPGDSLSSVVRTEVTRLQQKAAAYGFVAFAGTGTSKLVARAATLACKEGWLLRRPGVAVRGGAPTTAAFVPAGEEGSYLAPLPISYLPASPEVHRRLARLGIRTVGEAARIRESEWLRQLGPLGRQVAQWSRGVDTEPVKPRYPSRTLERRVEFAIDVRDRDHLEQVTNRSATILVQQLTQKSEGSQEVTLTLERSDAPPIRLGRTLIKLQQAVYPFQQALHTLLGQALDSATGRNGGVSISALTVSFGLIGPMPWQQLDLWDDSGRREREVRVERALTLLQERFPARMVGLGPRQTQTWREQMLQFSDPYRWSSGRPPLPPNGVTP